MKTHDMHVYAISKHYYNNNAAIIVLHFKLSYCVVDDAAASASWMMLSLVSYCVHYFTHNSEPKNKRKNRHNKNKFQVS